MISESVFSSNDGFYDTFFFAISELSSFHSPHRLSLKPGKTWLHLSTFASNLPGLPDNIRASGRGTYWVAMSQARHQNMSTLLDEYAGQPQMREMVAMVRREELQWENLADFN